METKLDRLQQANAERAKRYVNILKLRRQLQEAQDVKAVIVGTGFEETQERRIVEAHIRQLQDLLADEQRAFDSATAANPEEITNTMTL